MTWHVTIDYLHKFTLYVLLWCNQRCTHIYWSLSWKHFKWHKLGRGPTNASNSRTVADFYVCPRSSILILIWVWWSTLVQLLLQRNSPCCFRFSRDCKPLTDLGLWCGVFPSIGPFSHVMTQGHHVMFLVIYFTDWLGKCCDSLTSFNKSSTSW